MKPTVTFIVGLLLGLAVGRLAFGQSPASEVAAALRDQQQVPLSERPSTRYATLYPIQPEKRQRGYAALSLTLQCLSRSSIITPPPRVSETLVRINARDYVTSDRELVEWLAEWDRVSAGAAPFQLITDLLNGKRVKATVSDGPWTDPQSMLALRQSTNSAAPIANAARFIALGSIAPAYYGFLGVGRNEREFAQRLGIGRALSVANLAVSNITEADRRIIYKLATNGSAWKTLDVATADAEHDFLRRPIGDPAPKFDASEHFVMAANRMWVVAVFDNNGVRQDKVNDEIAKYHDDPAGKDIIRVGSSCLMCHGQESGLRSFKDDQSELFKTVQVASLDRSIITQLREYYAPNRMQSALERDRADHAEAVKQATGLSSNDAYAALAEVIADYQGAKVDLARAALQVGLGPEQLRVALRGAHDPKLLHLANGGTMRVESFEANFAECAQLAFNQVNR